MMLWGASLAVMLGAAAARRAALAQVRDELLDALALLEAEIDPSPVSQTGELFTRLRAEVLEACGDEAEAALLRQERVK